jgi:hypothetical protein
VRSPTVRSPTARSLLFLVEDYQRLWAVTGFAERFAFRLARPGVAGNPLGDPYHTVLGEHHRRLVAMLQASDLAGDRGPDELADALTGFYLSRRLAGARLEGWAAAAVRTIIGAAGGGGGDR